MKLFDRIRGYGDVQEASDVISGLDLRAPVQVERVVRTENGPVRYFVDMPAGDLDSLPPRAGTAIGGDNRAGLNDLYDGGPDVNPELSGRAKFDVYQQMRTEDPAVRSTLWMFKLAIRSAKWDLEPASEDPVDVAVHDACQYAFGYGDRHNGLLNQSFDAQLAEDLCFLDWGSWWQEMIFGIGDEVVEWNDADGDPHDIVPIIRLAPRHPASIAEIETDPRTGKPTFLKQDTISADPIPASKLAWYVWEKEGNNWWGTSLLRSMYGAWKIKRALLIESALAWERYASGIPIVRYPGGGDLRRAEQIGRNFRTHERGYVVLEGTKEAGWDVNIEGGANTMADPVPLLRHLDGQIAKAALQQFSELGSTETGARSVGEVLVEPFYLALSTVARHIAEQRQLLILRRFVDVNFGTKVEVPWVRVAKLQSKNLVALAAILADLSAAGFSFSDRLTQNDVRDQLDFRRLPEGFEEQVAELPDDVGITIPGAREGDPVALR